METRANYAIVGLFTLLVLAASFGFVYWMTKYGRTGDVAQLLIRIPGSANGLSVGSPVRFNGISVGSVRGLTIDRTDPNFVLASTEVQVDAPVYASTRAVLEIQGLTGSAYVELSGGTGQGENILREAVENDSYAELTADPSSVTNLLATADQILNRANNVIGEVEGFILDARGPLTNTLRNTETFSKALTDNADGIDQFLQSVASLSDTFSGLSGRLDTTFQAAERLLTSVDPAKVDSILGNVDRVTEDLAAASGQITETVASFRQTAESFQSVGETAVQTMAKVDSVLTNVDGEKVGRAIDDIAAASESARQAVANTQEITAKFGERSDDVDQFITDVSEMASRLNAASVRIDGVLAKVDGFLGEGDASNLLAEAEAAIASFKALSDNINARVGPIAGNLERFSGGGLRDVESLITETRRSIGRIERSISSIERNPQRLLFGGEDVKQFDGRVRR